MPHTSGAPRTRRLRALLGLGLAGILLLPLVATPGDAGTAAQPSTAVSAPATIATELLASIVEESPPSAVGAPILDGASASVSAPIADTSVGGHDPVEIVVLFEDAGVAPDAQGDPAAAAASLRAQADTHWARADAALLELERAGGIEVLTRFWVTSAVLVSAVPTEATLDALAAIPGATEVIPNFTVEPLDADEFTPLAEPSIAASLVTPEGTPLTYGLERIRAAETWRDFGAEGQGVRIAVLDTGVDANHPDIAGRLVGSGLGDPTYPGGWISFDRTGQPVVSRPSDPGSHGTHVAGTALGGSASGTQIGVAPRAQLMAANVLSGNGGGSLAKILAGMEWAISPTDAWGNPAGRPADVVNMSLGSSGYNSVFIPFVRNLRQAGIFPAIAIGNAPCGATGTSSPGDVFDSFGVGMTNAADEVDPGSCGAVTNWPAAVAAEFGWPSGFVKPDASAPGTAVFSAMPNGLWGESTGTSMAAPHVAGAVALIRSAQAGLTVDEIEAALESTAWHPGGPAAPPDTRYGHGRIDVHAAVAAVLGQSGILGTVRDSATDAPLAGVTVAFGDRGETWTTDETGRFTARLSPGVYALDASRFGYEPGSTGDVPVSANRFTEVDVVLEPITTGALAGIVADARSGAPLAGATVQVMGQPITATTTAAGEYRFGDMPLGAYQVRVSADGFREAISQPAEVRAALTTTVNYRLAALPNVLVLGDNGGRTAALLADNDFAAESLAALPEDLTATDYDVVIWDTPAPVSAERLEGFIAETEDAGTGVVWLDQGSSPDSGIALLQRLRGDPAERHAGNDRSLDSTGYRVVADHALFDGGVISSDGYGVGDVIVQNGVENGPKFFAWFEELTGDDVTVLAESVTRATVDESPVTNALGDGIAISQRAGNRHALLALHGSSPAVDVRTWSLASAQVFVNAVTWTAPPSAQAPDPEIIVPEPPVVDPGDGGPGGGTPQPPGAAPPPAAAPAPAPAPAAPRAAPRAPTTQSPAKPETTPEPPVASANQLAAHNAGGVTARVEDGIAHIAIPDAVPGTWYFLHVYPSKVAVDWIRVNDDGELRIDIARLPAGEHRFAFTDAAGTFVGWAAITVEPTGAGPATPTRDDDSEALADDGAPVAEAAPAPAGFALTLVEQLMLLGAGLLIMAAAVLLLLSARRRPTAPPAS